MKKESNINLKKKKKNGTQILNYKSLKKETFSNSFCFVLFHTFIKFKMRFD